MVVGSSQRLVSMTSRCASEVTIALLTMSSSLKAAQIIRYINEFISCLASTFIVLMILTEPMKGLASPYSRIIFALSIADVFFSLGLFLSPFVGPRQSRCTFCHRNDGTM